MICEAVIKQSVIYEGVVVPKYSSTNKQTLHLQLNNTPSEENVKISLEAFF